MFVGRCLAIWKPTAGGKFYDFYGRKTIKGKGPSKHPKLTWTVCADSLFYVSLPNSLDLFKAPHLQAQAEDLRKAQLGKRLNRKLSLRPDKDDLINRGYITADSRLVTPRKNKSFFFVSTFVRAI